MMTAVIESDYVITRNSTPVN